MKSIRHLLTESDNKTLCPIRILAVTCFVIFHAMFIAGIVLGNVSFDLKSAGEYLQYALSMTGISAASIGMKSIMRGDSNGAE